MNSEDKALKAILDGKMPERRIQSGYTPDSKSMAEKRRAEIERQAVLAERFKSVLMPWFCPSCNRVMNKRLDKKFWRIHQKCFDCVIGEHNQMMIDGTFDEYEKRTIAANMRSMATDAIDYINELRATSGEVVSFIDEHGEVEKWCGESQVDEEVAGLEKDVDTTLKLAKEKEDGLQK